MLTDKKEDVNSILNEFAIWWIFLIYSSQPQIYLYILIYWNCIKIRYNRTKWTLCDLAQEWRTKRKENTYISCISHFFFYLLFLLLFFPFILFAVRLHCVAIERNTHMSVIRFELGAWKKNEYQLQKIKCLLQLNFPYMINTLTACLYLRTNWSTETMSKIKCFT